MSLRRRAARGLQPARRVFGAGNGILRWVLRIPKAGWQQLKADWLREHEASMNNCTNLAALPAVREVLAEVKGTAKRLSLLDMNPGIGNTLIEASLQGFAATGIAQTRELFPTVLQRAENNHTFNITLRGGVHPETLPYPNGGVDILRGRTNGFNLVVNINRDPHYPIDSSYKQLAEAARVAAPNGKIVFGFRGEGNAGLLAKFAKNELSLVLSCEVTQYDGDEQPHQLLVFSKR